jgi:hypothetical protein
MGLFFEHGRELGRGLDAELLVDVHAAKHHFDVGRGFPTDKMELVSAVALWVILAMSFEFGSND